MAGFHCLARNVRCYYLGTSAVHMSFSLLGSQILSLKIRGLDKKKKPQYNFIIRWQAAGSSL